LGFIHQTFKRGGISVEGPVPACRFSADPFFRFAFLFFWVFFVSLAPTTVGAERRGLMVGYGIR
jgi:hypothetical protein